jgi:uncharacterized protein YchJ
MATRKVKIIAGNGKPFRAVKVNRNTLCPCGSGRKSKRCCNRQTQYYTKKDTPKTPPTL